MIIGRMRYRRTLQDINLNFHEVFLGGRQAESDRLEATEYSIADQLWMITSGAIKCSGPRTRAIELRSVVKQGTL